MNRNHFLIAIFLLGAISSNAQDAHYTDYYPRVTNVANGFRTVAEENALMEKEMAERRKQDRIDRGVVETKGQTTEQKNTATKTNNTGTSATKARRAAR
jgi:hypothetical protein